MAPKTTFARKCHPFSSNFGSPPGPKNRRKIDPWPKKGCQEASFYHFFSRTAFFSLPDSIFHRFLMKNRWKKWCIFSKQCAIFSTWRWPKSMHRRSVLSTFHFFHFLKIVKKDAKNRAKMVSPKNIEKWGPGGPQMVPKWLRINRKNIENLKNRPQNKFFGGSIFWWFLGRQKNFSRRL